MPRFGAHLSVSDFRLPAGGGEALGERVSGPAAAIERARELKCDCVQLFLRPNRQWHAPALSAANIEAFRAALEQPVRHRQRYVDPRGKRRTRTRPEPIHPVVSHAAYLINVAGPGGVRPSGGTTEQNWPKRDIRGRSVRALADELARAVKLGVPYVVLHPGNHMGDGDEAGLQRALEALDQTLDAHRDDPVTVLVETTAGQGTGIGHRLEHLAWLVEHSACPEKLAVCCDTCHMFAAGYDLRGEAGYEATMRQIERTVGLERVRLWHLNDCLKPLGSRVDRHTHIGDGEIGREGFRRLVNDPRWAQVAMVLETPKEDAEGKAMDPVNLRRVRRMVRG